MNKSLLSTAIALAFSASFPAMANPVNTSNNDDNTDVQVTQTATAESDQSTQSGAAANEYSDAFQNSYNPVSNSNNTSSFNSSSIEATTTLDGAVHDNVVRDIGNHAQGGSSTGDAGDGGNGGNSDISQSSGK
ncbi:MAG: hypothetical protein KKE84_13475, partial [Gammaproteobacteria bacterium]|nr:hypothetical protein [Gammaproteobacteria bacterium]